ncbi:MAG: nitronate monooxygenase [Novosphingobium sp.]|nr:nitronate monooxygenase [Novosphingobium sp.]MCP5403401.1 nitronate monooxygenase [Novosphingobium sp.]
MALDFSTNRVLSDCGTKYPVFQAPMGWIARSQLVSAVANAGGLGIMETSSGDFPGIREEIARMRTLTGAPWAINLPLAFLKHDDSILADVIASGVRFVTTSAGDPGVYAGRLQDAGIKVYHAVPSLAGARKAASAGVDGLIVEGSESAALRSPKEVGLLSLLRLVRRDTDLPIVAAGGIADGFGMAAAFALGAEAVQLGTRFVASAESPVHDSYKQGIAEAGLFETTVTNRGVGPCLRVLRTRLTDAMEAGETDFVNSMEASKTAYFGGDLNAGLVPAGESSALINEIEPVRTILDRMMAEFEQAIAGLPRLSGN